MTFYQIWWISSICLLGGYVIFIMHKIMFFVTIFAEIILFQLLNYQEGHLKVWPWAKSEYYIIPNPSTTLFFCLLKKYTNSIQTFLIQGTMSLDNRAELRAMLENFKLELESRQAEKRNLDHLLHKMMCEVKRVSKDIEFISKNQAEITSKLEEVMLVNESCEREHKKTIAKVENLLLEEKVLKLTERKVKEDLEQLHNDLKELRKEDLEINEQLRYHPYIT